MKPWLLNILACPIDKHHPLEAYFYSWETPEEDIKKNVEEAGLPNDKYEKNYKQISKQLIDGTINPSSIKIITDASDSISSKGLLAIAVDAITRLEMCTDKSEEKLLDEFNQDIDALYRYLNLLEVSEGLLVCPQCNRWYPIGSAVDTIPEMLPDELRERERDLEWMKKWSHVIPDKVLEEGNPYSTQS